MTAREEFGRSNLEGARALAGGAFRMARKHWIVAAIAAALIVFVSYQYAGGDEQAEEFDLAEARPGDVESLVTAAGNLQPLEFVDVGAQVSGQLEILHVDAGDEVEAGQLLAEIDATVQESEVESRRAELQNLQAQLQDRQAHLQLAQIQAGRQDRLMAELATSQEAFDSAQAALISAQAQLRSTEAQIAQSRSSLQGEEALLGYSRIYAPIAGTVSSIVAKQGQTLNANQQAPTILQIADLSVMTVSTQVSEADVPRLHVGMDAYFTTLGNGERRWYGKLRQILPTPVVLNNVVLYTALFDVENPGRELMSQMTAQVFFVIDAAYDVVRVPVRAIRYLPRDSSRRAEQTGSEGDDGVPVRRGPQPAVADGGARGGAGARGRPAVVTVVSADGRQEERDVMVGVSDRINAEIIFGLEEGEQVVLAAATRQEQENDNRFNRRFGRFGGPFGGMP